MLFKRKRRELETKYFDLWGATLTELLVKSGVDLSILKVTDEIMQKAITCPDDIVLCHKKLMSMRGA